MLRRRATARIQRPLGLRASVRAPQRRLLQQQKSVRPRTRLQPPQRRVTIWRARLPLQAKLIPGIVRERRLVTPNQRFVRAPTIQQHVRSAPISFGKLPVPIKMPIQAIQATQVTPPTPVLQVPQAKPSTSFYPIKMDIIHKKRDLFDKGLRRCIIEKNYHGEWELDIESYACPIVAEWKNTTAPIIAEGTPRLNWPSELEPVFVLSLRAERYRAFIDRMKHWRDKVELFPATDGRKISLDHWKQQGRLNCDRMTYGEVGCFES